MKAAIDIWPYLKKFSNDDYIDNFNKKFDIVFDLINLSEFSLFKIAEKKKIYRSMCAFAPRKCRGPAVLTSPALEQVQELLNDDLPISEIVEELGLKADTLHKVVHSGKVRKPRYGQTAGKHLPMRGRSCDATTMPEPEACSASHDTKEIDILADHNEKKLTVPLHQPANRNSSVTIMHLIEELNSTRTTFTGIPTSVGFTNWWRSKISRGRSSEGAFGVKTTHGRPSRAATLPIIPCNSVYLPVFIDFLPENAAVATRKY